MTFARTSMELDEEKEYSGHGSPYMGAIFMSNRVTKHECFKRKLFGLPSSLANFVKRIKAGTMLFLFEHEERKLYGVYEAISDGAMNIVPDAFYSSNNQYTAQIQFKIIWICDPLSEDEFGSAIKENYFMPYKFHFGLSYGQVLKLLHLFSSRKKERFPQKPHLRIKAPETFGNSGLANRRVTVKERSIKSNRIEDNADYDTDNGYLLSSGMDINQRMNCQNLDRYVEGGMVFPSIPSQNRIHQSVAENDRSLQMHRIEDYAESLVVNDRSLQMHRIEDYADHDTNNGYVTSRIDSSQALNCENCCPNSDGRMVCMPYDNRLHKIVPHTLERPPNLLPSTFQDNSARTGVFHGSHATVPHEYRHFPAFGGEAIGMDVPLTAQKPIASASAGYSYFKSPGSSFVPLPDRSQYNSNAMPCHSFNDPSTSHIYPTVAGAPIPEEAGLPSLSFPSGDYIYHQSPDRDNIFGERYGFQLPPSEYISSSEVDDLVIDVDPSRHLASPQKFLDKQCGYLLDSQCHRDRNYDERRKNQLHGKYKHYPPVANTNLHSDNHKRGSVFSRLKIVEPCRQVVACRPTTTPSLDQLVDIMHQRRNKLMTELPTQNDKQLYMGPKMQHGEAASTIELKQDYDALPEECVELPNFNFKRRSEALKSKGESKEFENNKRRKLVRPSFDDASSKVESKNMQCLSEQVVGSRTLIENGNVKGNSSISKAPGTSIDGDGYKNISTFESSRSNVSTEKSHSAAEVLDLVDIAKVPKDFLNYAENQQIEAHVTNCKNLQCSSQQRLVSQAEIKNESGKVNAWISKSSSAYNDGNGDRSISMMECSPSNAEDINLIANIDEIIGDKEMLTSTDSVQVAEDSGSCVGEELARNPVTNHKTITCHIALVEGEATITVDRSSSHLDSNGEIHGCGRSNESTEPSSDRKDVSDETDGLDLAERNAISVNQEKVHAGGDDENTPVRYKSDLKNLEEDDDKNITVFVADKEHVSLEPQVDDNQVLTENNQSV